MRQVSDEQLDALIRRMVAEHAADAVRVAGHRRISPSTEHERWRSGKLRPLAIASMAAVLFVSLASVGLLWIGTPRISPPGLSNNSLDRRPIDLPTVSPHQGCPATAAETRSSLLSPLSGGGPVYPVGPWRDGEAYYEASPDRPGWGVLDVIWISDPSYVGPVLLRARRLDDPSSGSNSGASDIQVRLPLGASDSATDVTLGDPVLPQPIDALPGWHQYERSRIYVRSQGCYGIQVDAVGFSEEIVFRARPAEDAIALLSRPMQLSTLGADICRPSGTTGSLPELGPLDGEGAVRLGPGLNGVSFATLPSNDGRRFQRTFWVTDGREQGPILVRGQRLDAPGTVEIEGKTSAELTTVRNTLGTFGAPPMWRVLVASVDLTAPGCYGFQADGLETTSVIIVRVVP